MKKITSFILGVLLITSIAVAGVSLSNRNTEISKESEIILTNAGWNLNECYYEVISDSSHIIICENRKLFCNLREETAELSYKACLENEAERITKLESINRDSGELTIGVSK